MAAKGLHRAQKVKGQSWEIALRAGFIQQPAEQKQIIYCWDSRFRGRVNISIVH
jgi:hypothetical protein